jgi:hypothetical protein
MFPINLTTLSLRFGMPSFSSLIGWPRVSLFPEAPTLSQRAPLVFGPYIFAELKVLMFVCLLVCHAEGLHKAED